MNYNLSEMVMFYTKLLSGVLPCLPTLLPEAKHIRSIKESKYDCITCSPFRTQMEYSETLILSQKWIILQIFQYLNVTRKKYCRGKKWGGEEKGGEGFLWGVNSQLIPLLLLHMVKLQTSWCQFFLQLLQLKSLPQLSLFLNWILQWNKITVSILYLTESFSNIAILACMFLKSSVKTVES